MRCNALFWPPCLLTHVHINITIKTTMGEGWGSWKISKKLWGKWQEVGGVCGVQKAFEQRAKGSQGWTGNVMG